ncbi:hypothetical protein HPB50_006201 [Hyalomma asiaticum]|uniref:Uncharacterized protein n=1 Tax=Hyalomma asiaticum TaxID=266040 RepID=A0ACB7TBL3_HYAAI|nr:hypothetical protein HPB50_006201 [Hyalomma asiaticum]
MNERDTLHLVQEIVLSTVTYRPPYQKLYRGETKVIETLIRGAVKAAFGLPLSTPTARLGELGLHNISPVTETAYNAYAQGLT